MSSFTDSSSSSSSSSATDDSNVIDSNIADEEPLGLLSLSADAIILILSKFLTIQDVSRLEIAYCNRKKRKQLLDILSGNSNYDHVEFDYKFKHIDSALLWIGTRQINISALSVGMKTYGSGHLTNLGLNGLAKHCASLQSLYISYCDKVTNMGIVEIAKQSCLQSLYIRRCWNITDIGIADIARNCTGLRSLNISHCIRITDIGIADVARNCTGLHSCDVSYCYRITDTGITNIVRYRFDDDCGCGDSGCSEFFLLALGFLDTNVDTFPPLLLSLLNNFRCIDLA